MNLHNKNIYALQTARAGSKSVLNKNILEVNGKPMYRHNVDYAKQSKYIKDVFVSTDCEYIKNNALDDKYKVIPRPSYLCSDDASHQETICHGIEFIEKFCDEKVDIIVILLGNSIGANTKDLDIAIEELCNDDTYDSIQSVSEFNMFNPFRAFSINDGSLQTIMNPNQISSNKKIENINDKNSAGDVYFFNGSFWICKRDVVFNKGVPPFEWLGNKIKPYVQDVCMEVDAGWQLDYLINKENK